LPPTLVLTDQHAALDPAEFGLEAYPAVRLGCPGEENPHRHVRMATAAMLPLLSPAPDLVVVQAIPRARLEQRSPAPSPRFPSHMSRQD
jgi:UDP-N-acetylglucosamine 2-epimerase (non-hydrolysing)